MGETVREALQRYVAGETTWNGLVERIREMMRSGLLSAAGLEQELNGAGSDRLITTQLAVLLKQAVAASPGETSDSTRVRPPRDSMRSVERNDPPRAAAQATESPLAPPTAASDPEAVARGRTPSDWSRLAFAEADREDVGVGTVLNGRFTLEEVLGHGGMGTVFRARDSLRDEAEDKNPYVAVKVLGKDFKRHPQSLVALQREAVKAQTLAHPNIITVHDFDRDGGTVYMWMELLDGEPLDQIMARSSLHGGMPLREVLPIVSGIGNALSYAHEKGIVHSDLKPSNIFVTRDGTVKVLDFGIARAIASPDRDRGRAEEHKTLFDAAELGAMTPAYASPEMLLDLEPHPRDDVYALACLTYEMLAGRHPFDRMPAHLAMHAGLALKSIRGLKRHQMNALRHGLAFTRGGRTARVQDFLAEFGERPADGNWLRASMMGGVLLAVGLGLGVVYYRTYSTSAQCKRIDEAFLSSLSSGTARSAVEEGTGSRDERHDEYEAELALGQTYLKMAEQQFDPAILSGDQVSTAYGAFTGALGIEPDSPAAAKGVLQVVELYAREAQHLLAEDKFADAAKIATMGLRIHPRHCGLNEALAAAQDAQQ